MPSNPVSAPTIVLVDDAHTFGGAQIALGHAIKALADDTSVNLVYVGTSSTYDALKPIVGNLHKLRFVECPPALRLNIFTFPARLLACERLIRPLMMELPDATWILNLSGIEFCVAPLTILRLRGVRPIAWLHNPERFASFTRGSFVTKRVVSWLRDMIADSLIFRQYKLILTPSMDTASSVRKRAGQLSPPSCALYPTITGVGITLAVNPIDGPIQMWMIGRLDYGHKNNALALATLRFLLDEGVAATLTVVGDGPDRERFFADVRSLDVEKHVRFHGWQQDPWAGMLPGAVVLIPSTWEANCLVAIEALLRNIRMAVTPISAFSEVYPSAIIAQSSSPRELGRVVVSMHRATADEMQALYGETAKAFLPTTFTQQMLALIRLTET